MLAKLTLSIDKNVIENAKAYAGKQKISVSKIVERYLASLFTRQNIPSCKLPPLTARLRGISAGYGAMTDKEALRQVLESRNLS